MSSEHCHSCMAGMAEARVCAARARSSRKAHLVEPLAFLSSYSPNDRRERRAKAHGRPGRASRQAAVVHYGLRKRPRRVAQVPALQPPHLLEQAGDAAVHAPCSHDHKAKLWWS
eukprot:1359959-Alexandrium_andersonii.AAC.1